MSIAINFMLTKIVKPVSKADLLIEAYEAKRAAKNKPCKVTYNNNGTFTIVPKNILVPYVVTAAELKARIAA
jgi:hypothetical protein